MSSGPAVPTGLLRYAPGFAHGQLRLLALPEALLKEAGGRTT